MDVHVVLVEKDKQGDLCPFGLYESGKIEFFGRSVMRWHQHIGTRLWVLAALVGSLSAALGVADEPSKGTTAPEGRTEKSLAPAPPKLGSLGSVAPAPPDVSKVLPRIATAAIVDPMRFGGPSPKFRPKRLPAPNRTRTASHPKSHPNSKFVRFQRADETGNPEYDLNLSLGRDRIIGNFLSSRNIEGGLPMWESSMESPLNVGDYKTQSVVESSIVRGSPGDDGVDVAWNPQTYTWTTPGFYHNPLYFEEINLERYGHSAGWGQPVASAAHFFGTVAFLPYKMGAYPRCETLYTLGHRRPGNCVPHQVQWVPFSWRGIMYQGGATVGGAYYLP